MLNKESGWLSLPKLCCLKLQWKQMIKLQCLRLRLPCQHTLKIFSFLNEWLFNITFKLLTVLTCVLATNHWNRLSSVGLKNIIWKAYFFTILSYFTAIVKESRHWPPLTSVVAPVPWMVKDSKSSLSQQISEIRYQNIFIET